MDQCCRNRRGGVVEACVETTTWDLENVRQGCAIFGGVQFLV